MPKLYSSKFIAKVLLKQGFIFTGQTGSHGKFRRGPNTAVVPMAKKEIPVGTFHSILRQSGLDEDIFKKGK